MSYLHNRNHNCTEGAQYGPCRVPLPPPRLPLPPPRREGGGTGRQQSLARPPARSETTLPPKSALRIIFLDFAVEVAPARRWQLQYRALHGNTFLLLPRSLAPSSLSLSNQSRSIALTSSSRARSHRRSFFRPNVEVPIRRRRWASLSKRVLRNAVAFFARVCAPSVGRTGDNASCNCSRLFHVYCPLRTLSSVECALGLISRSSTNDRIMISA